MQSKTKIQKENEVQSFWVLLLCIFFVLFTFTPSVLFAGGKSGPFEWQANIQLTGTYDDNIRGVFDEGEPLPEDERSKVVFFDSEKQTESLIDCPPLTDENGEPLRDNEGNILRECRAPESDFIVYLKPTANLLYRRNRLSTSLTGSIIASGYTGNFEALSDVVYFGALNTRWQAAKFFTLEAGDTLRATSVRRDQPGDQDEDNVSKDLSTPDFFNDVLTNLIQINQAYISPQFQFDFNRTFTETKLQDRLSYTTYLNDVQNVEQSNFDDYLQNDLNFQLFKARLRRLSIAPGANWIFNRYKDQANPHKFNGIVDFTSQPVKRLTLVFIPGWEWLILENENQNSFILNAKLQYLLSNRTNAYVRYKRQYNFSTAQNSTFDQTVAFGFRYQIMRSLESNLSVAYSTLSELSLPHENNDSENSDATDETPKKEEREEDILSLSAGLRYSIGKHWQAMAGYAFKKSFGRESVIFEESTSGNNEATSDFVEKGIFDFPGYAQNRVHIGINYLF